MRVPGHDFIGCGEARNKTGAQAIAAESFVNYLKEKGMVQPGDDPTLPPDSNKAAASHGSGFGPPPLMGESSYHGGAGPSFPPPSLTPSSLFAIKAAPPPQPPKQGLDAGGLSLCCSNHAQLEFLSPI